MKHNLIYLAVIVIAVVCGSRVTKGDGNAQNSWTDSPISNEIISIESGKMYKAAELALMAVKARLYWIILAAATVVDTAVLNRLVDLYGIRSELSQQTKLYRDAASLFQMSGLSGDMLDRVALEIREYGESISGMN